MKKQMNVGKTIAVIVCALLLLLAVGSIAFFTNGFTSDFKTFYVESDGKRMLSDYDNYIMKQDTENKFVVKYTFGAVNKDISGYTLKIVPNVSHDNDFDFTVDGEIYSFGAEEDLTKGFDITQNDFASFLASLQAYFINPASVFLLSKGLPSFSNGVPLFILSVRVSLALS